jgi:hypothetical protein
VLRRNYLLLGLCLFLTGCSIDTHSPSYFPHLFSFWNINQTHGKPGGSGYYKDFDKHACRIEVNPEEVTVPVRTQQVIIATVYDEKDQARRKRRVEWIAEGPGNILEVDESGIMPARGYKVDNKYAVSYTDHREHTFDRGNEDPSDDFAIRPGQSWCVISSATEGTTTVTVYAPGVHDWEQSRRFIKVHFVDAKWEFPGPGNAKAGSSYRFTTRIKGSTPSSSAGYRIRYRIVDGPEAVVAQSGSQLSGAPREVVVDVDREGLAAVDVRQLQTTFGTNRIAIEVIRADSGAANGQLVVAKHETKLNWDAAKIKVDITTQRIAQLNKELPVTFTVASTGSIEAQPMMLKTRIPPGFEVVSASEKMAKDGDVLVFGLPNLGANKSHTIQVILKPTQLGSGKLEAVVPATDGQRIEASADIQVSEAKLDIVMEGPKTGMLGEKIPIALLVRNPGNGSAQNLRIQLNEGLDLSDKEDPFKKPIDILGPNESRKFNFSVRAKQVGQFTLKAKVESENGLIADAQPLQIEIQDTKLSVQAMGPTRGYIDQDVTWQFRIRNGGTISVSNVKLVVDVPKEVKFKSATFQGEFRDGQLIWDLGTAPGQQEIIVSATVSPSRPVTQSFLVARLNADPVVERNGTFQTVSTSRQAAPEQRSELPFEVLGVPGLQMEVRDLHDPLQVGERTSFVIKVTNPGTLAANQVEVIAKVPKEFKPLRVQGPILGKIEGQTVRFPAIDNVRPGATATYNIEVEALAPGDVRLQAELRSQALPEPLRADEPSRIYGRADSSPPPPKK